MYSTTIMYLAFKCQQIYTKFKYNIRMNQGKVTNLEQPFYPCLEKVRCALISLQLTTQPTQLLG